MSKLRKIFTLQELLQASQLIAASKEAFRKALAAGRIEEELDEKLEQLSFYFGLDKGGVLENIEEIVSQLEKIIKTQEEYPFEFASYVPKPLLEYWQREAKRATKTREESDRLVEQRITAWIAGLKEKYAKEHEDLFPDGRVPSVNLIYHLESQKKKIEAWLERDERRVQKVLAPFEKDLTKNIEKALFSQAPREKRVRKNLREEAKIVARKTTEKLSRSPEIADETIFREKLEETLEEEVSVNTTTAAYFPEEEVPKIAADLSYHYLKVAQAINIRAEKSQKIGIYLDLESATNLPLEKPPGAIAEQLQAPPGKTIEDVWGEVVSWWYTQGYPFQTLLALIRAEPGLFRGGVAEITKNIREALVPGFPLRSQFLIILSASREELAARWQMSIAGGYEALFGKGSFRREYEKSLRGQPHTDERLARFSALIGKRLKVYLDLIDDGVLTEIQGKRITFEQKEELALYVHLLENIEKLGKFAEAHPVLAGSMRTVGRVFAFPVRHQKIFLLYQLSKTGAYAPRILVEFLTREAFYFAFRSAIVKLTERFWWGWTTKHIPFVGTKVVWKPLEAAKRWVKEKLAKTIGKILTKLGLKKLIAIILGGGVIGSLIITFKEPIKRALKALGLFFLGLLHYVAAYGPPALAIFGATTLVGAGAGIYFGAKIGGIIGAVVGGPVGGFIGALLGAGAVYFWVTKVLPWWHSLTVPAAAEMAGGAGAISIIELTPNAIIAAVTPVGIGALAAATIFITSSAFIIPGEERFYGSRYIQIQKGFDINGEAQEKLVFENDEIIGKNLNYGLTVTIVEKTLTNIVINDKLEIVKKTSTVYHEETWDKNSVPELAEMQPGDRWGINYTIVPDENFKDSYISNTVTVTSDEGETQGLTLTLTVGQPPVPESVTLARKIVDALLVCPGLPKKLNGVVVNQTTWPSAKTCLQNAGIPPNIITLLEDFIDDDFFNLQCVHFAVAATSGVFSSKPVAKLYCTQTTPGYPLLTNWEDLKEGDIIASGRGETGHIALVVRRIENSKRELLYAEVAEALGNNGVVQYRRIAKSTLISFYCGYLRKGG